MANLCHRIIGAIAFTDDNIRLDRQQSSQTQEARLDLQEAFRIICSHLHKLQFVGDRLLVCAPSEVFGAAN